MSEDQSYEELLEQNVGEVKNSVRDLEDPDYGKLLQLEKEGKDRKTVKEFLEAQMGDEEGSLDEEEPVDEETEEIVEEIEEGTSEGLLGSFSPGAVLAGGIVFGILIGLIAGFGASSGTGMASQQAVQDSVTELFTASGLDSSQVEVVEYSKKNGMHYISVNVTQQAGNETQTSSRSYYVSPDGKMLFPELQSPLVTTPINIEQTLQRMRAQETNGNSTSR